MSIEDVVAAHLAVFNSPAGPARAEAIAQVYAEDVVVGLPHHRLTGHAGVERGVREMQTQMPGMVITRTGPVHSVHELLTFTWATGPKSGQPVATGREVVLVRDGSAVAAFYVLVDTR